MRLPLLAGLCLLDLVPDFIPDEAVLAGVFLLDVRPAPDLAFASLEAPVLRPDAFFLLDVECVAVGFWLPEGCPLTGSATITKAKKAARYRWVCRRRGSWLKIALILSLYL